METANPLMTEFTNTNCFCTHRSYRAVNTLLGCNETANGALLDAVHRIIKALFTVRISHGFAVNA
jgi:hypothetical protein